MATPADDAHLVVTSQETPEAPPAALAQNGTNQAEPATSGDFTKLSMAELMQLDLVLLPDGGDAAPGSSDADGTVPNGNNDLPQDLTELSLVELMNIKVTKEATPDLPDLAPTDTKLLLEDDASDELPSHLSPEGGLTPIGVLPGTASQPPLNPAPPPPSNEINFPPNARDDAYTVTEDGTLSLGVGGSGPFKPPIVEGVLTNDSDPNADGLTVALVTPPAHGTLTLNADGSFIYEPDPNFGGVDSFTYVASDGRGATNTATVTLNVTPVADVPALTVKDASGNEDTPIALKLSSSLTDKDGSESLSVKISGVPAGATLSAGTYLGGGVWQLTPAQLAGLTLIPRANSDNDFDLTVTATSKEKSNGDTASTVGTIHVTVDAVADAPKLTVTDVTGNEDTKIALNVSSSLTDKDGSESLSLRISSIPVGATLSDGVHTFTATAGNTSANITGWDLSDLTIQSAPNSDADFNLTVIATSTEKNGGDKATVVDTIHVDVVPVNDPPVAVDDTNGADAVIEDVDATASGNVLANDKDADPGDTLGVTPGSFTGTYGTLTLNADGSWTYTLDDADPDTDGLAAGQKVTDSFTYTVSDGTATDTGTLVVTVTGSNDTPTITSGAQAGAATELADGAPGENGTNHQATGTITFADVDVIDTHSASFTPQAGGYLGTLTLGAVDQSGNSVGWTFSVNDSALDFLGEGETRTQVYTVTINDGKGGTVTQDVTITLTGTNDGPVIGVADLSGTVTEDAATPALTDSGTVAFTDVDLIDTHGAAASFLSTDYSGGQLGSLTASVTTDTTGTGTGGVVTWNYSVDNADVQFLGEGETITETYQVTLTDSKTGGTVTQDVTVTITGDNDAPTITSGAQSGSATELADGAPGENSTDHPATGSITFADVDLIDTHSASFAPQAGGYLGTLTLDPVDQGANSVGWTFSVNDGALDFLADGETRTQIYAVTVDDGHSGTVTQDIAITLTGTNDAPTAVDDAGSTDQNSTLIVSAGVGLLTNDTDVDLIDTHTVSAVEGDAKNVGTQIVLASGALLTVNADGSYSYDANGQFDSLAAGDSTTDSFSYAVSDGHGGTDTATVTITIDGINDAPVVAGEEWAVSFGSSLSVSTSELLANDTDPDTGDSLSVTGVSNDINGTAGLVGTTVTYTADPTTNPASFDYTVTDNHSASTTGTVSVTNVTVTSGGDIVDLSAATVSRSLIEGGDGNDLITGSSGRDSLDGGNDNDTLAGGGGVDTLRGGAGNDVLTWDPSDTLIDGGSGNDRLLVDSATLDIGAVAPGQLSSIEEIDLSAAPGTAVTLSAQDVLDLSETGTLTILGDASDSVNAGSGWTDGGIVGGNHIYTQALPGGTATLVVDTDINTSIA